MAPQSLTVLAPIRQGDHTALRAALRAIGDDIKGRRATPDPGHPRIDFERSSRIHFARFAILDDPDRGSGRMRLLYAAVYDGSLAEHLGELAAVTSDLDAIWGACEGYDGRTSFESFMRARALEPEAYYAAFRSETAATIRFAMAARERNSIGWPPRRSTFGTRLMAALASVVRAAPLPVDVIRAVARSGFANVYAGVRGITASLDRYTLFRFTNWIGHNRMPPRRSSFSSVALDNCAPPAPLAPGDEIPSVLMSLSAAFREDAIMQNQLTLVTVVDTAGADRVRAVMSAIDSYAKRLSPPGSLMGISTIHFVRWLLIDDGRRLMMLSDYDNSWENYIDEFAEMILSGLDAIWSTAVGFPPDGARDLPAFKRFLRCHQVPSEVFYSAYPDRTVLNIAAATALTRQAAR